jgi:hypothetical protein
MLACVNSLVLQLATADCAAGFAVSVCIVKVLLAESAAALLLGQDHNAHCVRATFQNIFPACLQCMCIAVL